MTITERRKNAEKLSSLQTRIRRREDQIAALKRELAELNEKARPLQKAMGAA